MQLSNDDGGTELGAAKRVLFCLAELTLQHPALAHVRRNCRLHSLIQLLWLMVISFLLQSCLSCTFCAVYR